MNPADRINIVCQPLLIMCNTYAIVIISTADTSSTLSTYDPISKPLTWYGQSGMSIILCLTSTKYSVQATISG
ncbi:hypothetical protein BDZ97DRAFT_145540 [Flammula alnicola]|nr:hypothetical protein BDZ97DRAFT_145540 [Flammula alnicola]